MPTENPEQHCHHNRVQVQTQPGRTRVLSILSLPLQRDDLDDKIEILENLNYLEQKSGADRVADIHINEALWLRFRESDDLTTPYPPCDCHNLPRGSCPEFKEYHVDRISRGLEKTGLTPNMDGLREPLKFPSFPVDVWRWALDGYFDGAAICDSFYYGWDLSFTE